MKPSKAVTAQNFTDFSARAYLEEYFSHNGLENQALLIFLHEVYKTLPHQGSLIEIGGGPCIYQLISARNKVDYIIFSDFAQNCREEIRKFVQNDKDAFNWDEYIKYVLKLEGKQPNQDLVELTKEEIKTKIKAIIPCDVRNKNPLSPVWCPQCDVLSMHSVPDAISATEKEFIENMTNPLRLLRLHGYFLGMYVKNSPGWKCGGVWYKSFPVDEQFLRKLFPQIGLSLKNISTVDAEFDQGYDGLISVFAIKNSE